MPQPLTSLATKALTIILKNSLSLVSILANRLVYLDGVIDDPLANALSAQILYLNAEDNAIPILLFINTQGGSVTAGLAIYDTIKYINAPVWTVGVEVVAGIGALLLSAGAKGNRSLLPESTVALTRISSNLDNTPGTLEEIAAKEVDRIHDLIIYAFASETSRSFSEICDFMQDECAFKPDRAVQYGFADTTISTHTLLRLITYRQ